MLAMPPLTLPPVPQAAPPVPAGGGIVISLTAALALTAAVIWALARVGASRGRTINLPAGFVAGALIFTFVYALNRIAMTGWRMTAVAADLLLLSSALAFPMLRTGHRRIRLKAARKRRSLKLRGPAPAWFRFSAFSTISRRALSPADLRMKIEIANLENMLKLDPHNTFCLEKLSELYEKVGRAEMALNAARAAAKQDPAVRNKWRVKELEEKFGKKK